MIHTIQNEFLTVSAAEKGAELMRILGADGTEYLWQGDSKYWSDRALNIFPYVARLNEGKYYLDGQLHEMAIHGIAPYRDFTVTENDGSRMVFELRADEKTYAEYPRNFVFQIVYALQGKTLTVSFRCENLDGKTMYFGLGGHPGFLLPFTPGKAFTDYQLRFPAPCQPRRVVFSETCFCTGDLVPYTLQDGTTIPLQHSLFDDDAIVLADTPKEVTLSAAGDSRSVTVTFPDMDYIGFWQFASNDTPFLCIEPWSSLPSPDGKVTVFEEQKDLLSLPGGDCYENTWSIRVDI
jgi:galactose mutarotase-like enzyme